MNPANVLMTLIPVSLLSLSASLAAEETTAPAPAAETQQSPAAINQQLAELIARHSYDDAYALAASVAARMEGDPAFDFHFGFSAAQSGHFNDALFPFERLVATYPAVPRYRLELARTYFHLGNPQAAEEQFLLVRNSNPPADVVATIDGFLQKIAEEKQLLNPSWAGFVTITGGYDTNYNSATNTEQVDLFDGAFTAVLDSDSRRQSSSFTQLRAQSSYISPLSMRSAWDVQLGGSRKDNSADDVYDLDNLYAAAGLRVLRGNHNLHTGLRLSRYWLGEETLVTEYSLNNEWRYPIDNWMLKGSVNLRSQDNALNDELDLDQIEIQFGGGYGNRNVSLQGALVAATDQGDADYQARNTAGLNLSGQYLLTTSSSLYANLMLRRYWFQGEYPDTNAFAAGETRDESMAQVSTGYGYTVLPWATLYAQFSHIRYHSNIELYDYTRTLSEAGLTLSF